MTKLNTLVLAGLTGAGLLASATAARALTITQSIQFGPGVTDYAGASKTLNLFDTNAGTLNSISFTSTFGFNSTINVMNAAQGSSTGSVNTESGAAFRSSNGAVDSVIQSNIDTAGDVIIGADELNPASFDLRGQTRTYSLAPGASATVQSNAATQTVAPGMDTTASDLQAFSKAGGGAFDVLFSTITGTNLNNRGGNTSSSQNTTATGTFSIAYDYAASATPAPTPTPTPTPTTSPTSVPEPASMMILGAGLVGLGVIRRRRA